MDQEIIYPEDSEKGFYIWCKCNTPYPVKGMEGKALIGIFLLKAERDKMLKACQARQDEVIAAVQALESVPPSPARAKPSNTKERLLSQIQKSCGIKNT